MRIRLLALAVMMIATLPSAAHAIDCARASSQIDHMICADPKLVRADAAMNRAYAAILKAAPDPEIRAMLVTSQKRWIAARDKNFGSADRARKTASKATQRSLVLYATEDRANVLAGASDGKAKRPYLIRTALNQRRFAAQFTGGPFAGFETSCDFFPPANSDGSLNYECFGTHHLQNDDRICSQERDWATYSVYTSRSVADIIGGKPKLVATCKDDGCEDDDTGKDAGWDVHPEAASAGAFPRSLPKLDAEVMDSMIDDEPSWLKACLTDKRFPLARSRK